MHLTRSNFYVLTLWFLRLRAHTKEPWNAHLGVVMPGPCWAARRHEFGDVIWPWEQWGEEGAATIGLALVLLWGVSCRCGCNVGGDPSL